MNQTLLTYLACAEDNVSWGMAMDHCKLDQVVTPIAAAVPGVNLLLEQTNSSSSTWHATLDLADAFYSISFSNKSE